jgi:hypothetical protein
MDLVATTDADCGLEAPVLARSRAQRPGFELARHGDAARESIEGFIRDRFAAAHDARVRHFLPALISLGFARHPVAAVGIAFADETTLFAETYLDAPIEALIARVRDEPVARAEVVEIGNLVSTWSGGGLLLFVFLAELLDRLGPRWAIFTATLEVQRLLAHLGFAPTVLGEADPARLSDGGSSWGRYYERGPRVMFGEIPPAVAAARRTVRYRMLARLVAGQVARVEGEWRSRCAGRAAAGAA